MKKYSILILSAIILILISVFIWNKLPQPSKQQSQSTPFQIEGITTQAMPSPTATPAPKPSSGLQISSPCEGESIPVCGEDGKTYASDCIAQFLGIKVKSQGMCPKQIIK